MTDRSPGWSTPDTGLGAPAPAPPPPPTPTAYGGAGGFRRGLLPLRPMATGEVLDGAVNVTRAFPRTVLAFGAAIALVTSLLDLVITLTLVTPAARSTSELSGSSDTTDQVLGSAAVGTGLSLLVTLVTQAVMAGVMTAVVGRAVLGDGTSLRQAWDEVRPRLALLVGLSLLVGLAVYGSFFGAVVLFVLLAATAGAGGALLGLLVMAAGGVAAIWLYVRWSLAPAVLVLEKGGLKHALRRSGVLVKRAFWRICGILLLAQVIALTVTLVVQLPFQLLGYSPFSGLSADYTLTTGDAIIGAVSGAFATTLVAPFSAGVRALLYVDRRMRAEGLDVALVAASRVR